jgi:hypothetical protein
MAYMLPEPLNGPFPQVLGRLRYLRRPSRWFRVERYFPGEVLLSPPLETSGFPRRTDFCGLARIFHKPSG